MVWYFCDEDWDVEIVLVVGKRFCIWECMVKRIMVVVLMS